ncbi:hypothetical protein Micbo1qcDRAFT_163526 [Microdochium bolleyi]|uniref:AA1-like domain-containing protein n=1 Tax=Microdochium bolleyi TaxID=196109 RepID=A0A136J0Z8_9PEZI|nr:hypothetical protein Micbo1qcDRAFT_163526 [Microdochium bolleyi]
MRFTTVCAAFAAALPSSATMFRIASDSIDYPWAVSNWNAECSAFQKCRYKFTITAEGNHTTQPKMPYVQASCKGEGPNISPAYCEIIDGDDVPTGVAAQLLPSPPSSNATLNGTLQPAEIQISIQHFDFDSKGVQWNYTGTAVTVYNGLNTNESLNFNLKPTEIWGIA